MNADMINTTEELLQAIKAHARQYVDDNIPNPDPMDYLYTENAFLAGAAIALSQHD
jgi:hypothetical protein